MTQALVVAALLLAPAASDRVVLTLPIGSPAPDFDLMGADGKRHSLKEFEKAKVLVVVFTANHCPTAQAYEERIKRISDDYKTRGVALVAISPNDPLAVRADELGYTDLSDSLEEMAQRAKDHHFTFPYLYDGGTQEVARKYGPQATPHVFIFDESRLLRFVGRIDDSENPEKVQTSDTRNALDRILEGKAPEVETTKVFGCSIKWSEKRASVLEEKEGWKSETVSLETVKTKDVKEIARNATSKPRLINAWATWCGPCVTEFPDLVETYHMYRARGLEVVTVSADTPDSRGAAESFLKDHHASMRNVILDSDDTYALIEALDPEWPGAVPYTLLVAPGGKVLYRSVGGFDKRELRKAVVEYLGRTYHAKPKSEAP